MERFNKHVDLDYRTQQRDNGLKIEIQKSPGKGINMIAYGEQEGREEKRVPTI